MTAVLHARFERLPTPNAVHGRVVEVQFNPSEYTLTKGNQLAEVPIPGLDQPLIQFVRGQTETLTLDLFFDSTEDGTGGEAKPVTGKTDAFYDLIKIDSNLHAPPVLLFSWGGPAFPGKRENNVFKCVVASVRQQFTFFNPAGVPLRAKLTVELREYKSLADQIRQLKLKSADHTKARVAVAGDTVSSLAYSAYGDPGAWRLIADANGLDDPLGLEPGTILRLPRAVA
ncbi:CIS tube protein [Solirubrobacter soli]|uniref:CIS tube protein n=1 Tax=Solirubrobacter soli TaxID=363832 RepID=UPI0004834604|nr:LysM peptidoglycan-binding domain-containing protein [Solirubrobacter soli]